MVLLSLVSNFSAKVFAPPLLYSCIFIHCDGHGFTSIYYLMIDADLVALPFDYVSLKHTVLLACV